MGIAYVMARTRIVMLQAYVSCHRADAFEILANHVFQLRSDPLPTPSPCAVTGIFVSRLEQTRVNASVPRGRVRAIPIVRSEIFATIRVRRSSVSSARWRLRAMLAQSSRAPDDASRLSRQRVQIAPRPRSATLAFANGSTARVASVLRLRPARIAPHPLPALPI